jgi:SpoVK/Ycf46/Vps4 family AAA+-type ATPase
MSGNFTLIHKIKFAEINETTKIPKSDLALQDSGVLYQFKFNNNSKNEKKTIKPGIFLMKMTNLGLNLVNTELGKKRLLTDVVNSKMIIDEADRFFNNLKVYEELDRQKKRGVLIYSAPGLGKSSTISHFCTETARKDKGTVVMVWPTSRIDSDDVLDFLATGAKYSKSCTKLILILEDIGGSEQDGGGRRGVDAGMLNLLDGVSDTFKLPTFIVATTNHPENLLESLADRPGRFDLMMELLPPSAEERVRLTEFIAKRALTEEEKEIIMAKRCDGLSIAHLDEIVVRSLLHGKTFEQTLKEILDHRKSVKAAFEKAKQNVGFSLSDR